MGQHQTRKPAGSKCTTFSTNKHNGIKCLLAVDVLRIKRHLRAAATILHCTIRRARHKVVGYKQVVERVLFIVTHPGCKMFMKTCPMIVGRNNEPPDRVIVIDKRADYKYYGQYKSK